MSHKQFTWWRRFHSTRKLKDLPWKGYSELIQRIDHGEYEWNHLGAEYHLENVIYQQELADLKLAISHKSQDVIDDAAIDLRKKFSKRKNIILERHLIEEDKLLNELTDALAKEFEMQKEEVQAVMETFDGTTRHLYYHLQALRTGRALPTADQVELIIRTVEAQPRHLIKWTERQWLPLWQEVVADRGWAL